MKIPFLSLAPVSGLGFIVGSWLVGGAAIFYTNYTLFHHLS